MSQRNGYGEPLIHMEMGSDRFIPRKSSSQQFKVLSKPTKDAKLKSPDNRLGREDVHMTFTNGLISARLVGSPGDRELSFSESESNSRGVTSLSSSTSLELSDSILKVLGFTENSSRILNYQHISPASLNKLGSKNTHLLQDFWDSNDSRESSDTPKNTPKAMTPYKVLDSNGLRDDFYSNLISWSKKSEQLIVGLHNKVYVWSESLGPVPLNMPGVDLVSCVSFSDDDNFCVGTQRGSLILFNLVSQNPLCVTQLDRFICTIQWFSNSSGFLVGDENGSVFVYSIKKNLGVVGFKKITSLKYHSQQICGKFDPNYWLL